MRPQIIFMGTPTFAASVLKSLKQINLDIIAVISQPDKEIGRKKILTKTPVKETALKFKIPVLQAEKIINIKDKIEKLNPDFIITCAFGQFIPKSILAIPKNCINIHPSLLPKLRGGAPIHWSIINGDKKTGITVMKMISKMDAGPIYLQKKIDILEKDTMIEVHNKLVKLSDEIIKKYFIDILNNKLIGTEQNEKEVTFGYNISREDEKIDFNDKVKNIHNKIRGLFSWPIAFSILNNKIQKIYSADFEECIVDKKIKNGRICKLNKNGIYVKAENGFVILTKIQLNGKKPQNTFLYYKNSPKEIYVGGIYE